MSFLNASLLLGLTAVAVPVLLHFLMKQKPRKLEFPALRLVQERRRQSVRRLQLRHIGLLLLRMLLLGLLILALARPALPPAHYSLTAMEWGSLLALIAAAVAGYLWSLRRLRQQSLSAFQLNTRQATLRGRWTVGCLAGLLLCVGWPYQRRIAAELTHPRPVTSLEMPVAGVMLFDNSLSMSALQAGETMLQQAQGIARAHLRSLPSGSRIAVGDSGIDRPIPFQTTILSAQSRIDALETHPAQIPLDERLDEALKTHEEDRRRTLADQESLAEPVRKDRFIRRIYLFTDLARSAWRVAGSSALLSRLQRDPTVNLYVVDVGRTHEKNQAVTGIPLSGERIPLGGELLVSAVVQSQGEDIARQGVELLLLNRAGNLLKQGQTTVRLDNGVPATANFAALSGMTQPWLHGQTRLIGTDALMFDNSRFFTVQVSEPPAVLVSAPDVETARAWTTALAPHDRHDSSLNRFKPHFEPLHQLADLDLSGFSAVTLINCPELPDRAWSRLGQYVENGGGLIVILGNRNIRSANYRRASAQQILPGQPEAWQSAGDWNLVVTDRNHPLFSIFRQLENYGAFSLFENRVQVTHFWKVTPAAGAQVLARYHDPERPDDPERWPAILERPHGQGRVVLFTTAADLPENSRERWNNLPSPLLDPWLFLSFVEQLTDFASKLGEQSHNFLCGQTPVLPIAPAGTDRQLLLRHPDVRQSRVTVPAHADSLKIENAQIPGHYELIDPAARETLAAFSMNIVPGESDLTRLTQSDLNDRLGEDRYQLAQSLDELKDRINTADLGQEIFPLLLVLVIAVFCGEHLVANRFYQQPADPV